MLPGGSGAIWCFLVLSEPIYDYLVLSGAIWGYLVLSMASGAIRCRIWGYLGLLVLSVAIWGNLGLVGAVVFVPTLQCPLMALLRHPFLSKSSVPQCCFRTDLIMSPNDITASPVFTLIFCPPVFVSYQP